MKPSGCLMECSGSLTPELEGAQHTRAHPVRTPVKEAQKAPGKAVGPYQQ